MKVALFISDKFIVVFLMFLIFSIAECNQFLRLFWICIERAYLFDCGTQIQYWFVLPRRITILFDAKHTNGVHLIRFTVRTDTFKNYLKQSICLAHFNQNVFCFYFCDLIFRLAIHLSFVMFFFSSLTIVHSVHAWCCFLLIWTHFLMFADAQKKKTVSKE